MFWIWLPNWIKLPNSKVARNGTPHLKRDESDPIWIDFPVSFGRDLTREEQYVAELDAKTGASLKLHNFDTWDGRIWTSGSRWRSSVAYR